MSDFNPDSVAREAMAIVEPKLIAQYATIVRYWCAKPNRVPKRSRSAPEWGSPQFIRAQANAFASSRTPRPPKQPKTVPDRMVSLILYEFFGIPAEQLEQATEIHKNAMAAENIVGDLLERYLASVMEPQGWVWCSGALIKAIDFIRPPNRDGDQWRELQVKNRDNSENSSSAAVRDNTEIEKWFRTFSRREGSNWSEFPDPDVRPLLSEDRFEQFVRDYLIDL